MQSTQPPRIINSRAGQWWGRRRAFVVWSCVVACVLSAAPGFVAVPRAQQSQKPSPPSLTSSRVSLSPARPDSPDALVARAISVACAEREVDPQGSLPIDEMQSRPSLPTLQREAMVGAERATRLLRVAQTLTAEVVGELFDEYRAGSPAQRAAALRRLRVVARVTPDEELRDNASVLYREPHAIRFGTLFLAGLRSDEAMISVLAHELTHVADGPRAHLAELFRRVGQRAAARTRLRLGQHRAEELTCDLVGALAARRFIARAPNTDAAPRRAARVIEHNCVERDDTDLAHLSPRTTMRALLFLAPALVHDLTDEQGMTAPTLVPQDR